MFTGKESLNRIELSRLVLELLNFGVSGSLQLWGVGVAGYGWGVVGGVPHTHVHMHVHACTCMHGKHDNFMQMAAPIGFGEIPGIPYDVICVHACICVHVHMCRGHPLTHPHPIHPPPPPREGTPRISQNSVTLELIEIFQFRLKI